MLFRSEIDVIIAKSLAGAFQLDVQDRRRRAGLRRRTFARDAHSETATMLKVQRFAGLAAGKLGFGGWNEDAGLGAVDDGAD